MSQVMLCLVAVVFVVAVVSLFKRVVVAAVRAQFS